MFLLTILLGCGAPCQSMCSTMAEYAAECGYSVSQDELESCTIANENPTEEYAAACLEADDPAKLREWWTCEELAENFTNGSK